MRISVTILRPFGPFLVPLSGAVLMRLSPRARTHVIAEARTAVTMAVLSTVTTAPGAGPALRGVTQLADVGRPVPVQGVVPGPHHGSRARAQGPRPGLGGGQGVGCPVAPGHPGQELVSGAPWSLSLSLVHSSHTNHPLLCSEHRKTFKKKILLFKSLSTFSNCCC